MSELDQNRELKFYTELIAAFARAMASRRLYDTDHPHIREHIKAVTTLVEEYFRHTEKEIFIGIYENNFVLRGERVFGPSLTGKMLSELAEKLHCGGFIVAKTLQLAELNRFLDLTAGGRLLNIENLDEACDIFAQNGIESIRPVPPYKNDFGGKGREIWEGEETGGGGFPDLFRLKQEMYDVVVAGMREGGLGEPLDMRRTRSVSEFMLGYMRTNFVDVLQSVIYPKVENYTVNHSVRVAALAVYAASQMGRHDKELLAIGSAALLHDVGKCSIPDDILNKKGRLTKAEFDIIKGHPKVGAEILSRQKKLPPHVLAAAWGHHIRHDGGGYPAQSSWAVRSPVSSLLQICDVFEALTAVRPYKEPMTPQAAFTIMIKDKGAFHPQILASFIRLTGLYPSGTGVKLDNGCYAVAGRQTGCIDRPEVTVIMEKGGKRLDKEERYSLNLEKKECRHLEIERIVLSHEDIAGELVL